MSALLLFGAPGSGKGTQSSLLVERLGYKHISTGDLFRAAMKNGTPLGKEAQKFVDQGKLVPDEITIGLVEEVLSQLRGKKFILDGFPRTEPQAKALERLLDQFGIDRGPALFLTVASQTLLSRLTGRRICQQCGAVYHVDAKPTKAPGVCDLCGGALYQRKDDTMEVVGTRLEAYAKHAGPLQEYYRGLKRLVEINGDQDAESVFKAIQQSL